MRRYRKSLIGLSLFTVLAVAMTWMVYATLQREIAGPTKTYTATFTDVLGMAPGDDVRVAGVRVGRWTASTSTSRPPPVRHRWPP